MTTTTDLLKAKEAWHYLIKSKDAPEIVKTAAQQHLDALDAAGKAVSQSRAQTQSVLQSQLTAQRSVISELLNQSLLGKKPATALAVANAETMTNAMATAQRIASLTETLYQRLVSLVCGSLCRQYQDLLLQWIAQRRSADADCGYTKDLTPDVQWFHDQLQIYWLPKWDQELALTTNDHRVSLLYRPTQSAAYRASCQWLWQQVAAGRYDYAAPLGASNNAKPDRLRVTSHCDGLPTVPPMVTQKPQTKAEQVLSTLLEHHN